MAEDVAATNRVAPVLAGAGTRVALVNGRFNDHITTRLLDGARHALAEAGVAREDIFETWVPGAFEVPLAAKAWAESGRVDAVVCLGAVIRGETGHYEFVAGECARGIQDAQLATGVPVAFGVLTTETLEQALARSSPEDNKGAESAHTALEMVAVLAAVRTTPS
jgi:6,7-dimethyl-8-ribityllumazine synthase